MAQVTDIRKYKSVKSAADLLAFYKKRISVATNAEYVTYADAWHKEQLANPNHILTLLKGLYLSERAIKIFGPFPEYYAKALEFNKNMKRALELYK